MDKNDLYRKAWAKWGDLQFIMIIEEPAELIKAVTKYLRNKTHENKVRIAEEVADTEIMIEQFRVMFPEMNEIIENHKKEKLERLERNLR